MQTAADRAEASRRENDMVFLALTRPAMTYGIPMEAWAASPPACFIFMLAMGGQPWWFLLPAPFILLGGRAATAWNYHFARRWKLGLADKLAAMEADLLGAISASPSRAALPINPEDFPQDLGIVLRPNTLELTHA